MPFKYQQIDRVQTISKKDFLENYVLKSKPVVIERLIEDWQAYDKWNLAFIKEVATDKIVPLYNSDPVDYTKKVNEPVAKMRMADYIDLLHKGPSDLRIFFYNILKEVPSLMQYFKYPNIGLKFMKSFPVLFFGGEGANVFMHYDIDWPDLMHFHFNGKKQCVLVPPNQSKYMYEIPYTTICREDIDFDNPDFDKWPALKNITPLITNLSHGETLFIPSGYWHYMKYITPGFSMSFRSISKNKKNFVKGVYNVIIMRNIDNVMRKIKGKGWIDYKNNKAIANTNKAIGQDKKKVMGRAFEYRKASKFARWDKMAKAFTKAGREINMAIKQSGPNPDANLALRRAIQNAKAVQMPKDRIDAEQSKERHQKDAEDLKEIVYEGIGPHGVAFVIETTTDNPVRTVANVRLCFNKLGGSLGMSNMHDFIFNRKGVFFIKRNLVENEEDLEFSLIDGGLDKLEFDQEQDTYIIYVDFKDFGKMQETLEELKLPIEKSELQRIPNMIRDLTEEQIDEVLELVDRLEQDNDVQNVFVNLA